MRVSPSDMLGLGLHSGDSQWFTKASPETLGGSTSCKGCSRQFRGRDESRNSMWYNVEQTSEWAESPRSDDAIGRRVWSPHHGQGDRSVTFCFSGGNQFRSWEPAEAPLRRRNGFPHLT